MEWLEKLDRGLERWSDAFLAIAVMALVSLIVFPIPPALLDVLIAINIGIGVLVVLVALGISDATKLPSFPTILLLTTLFRIGLVISTTRGILAHGDAGEIVRAFGQFVVGGDYVVGATVFVLIVIIQFVVIAKGAERVAEVSARFTLDAMQGKQASIEYDLSNSSITPAEAKTRRRALENESKLYGALDGAMKFVKGDAIVAILCVFLCVTVGLALGVSRDHLSLAAAAKLYTTLTIGDGLQAQVPSLLMSLAAGMIVTRVASEEGVQRGGLGVDIVRQLFASGTALTIAALFFVLLGLSDPLFGTGMPSLPFLGCAAFALALAAVARRRSSIAGSSPKKSTGIDASADEKEPAALRDEVVHSGLEIPWAIEFGPQLEPLVRLGIGEGGVKDVAVRILRRVREDLGVDVSGPRICVTGKDLEGDGYVVKIWGAPIARGRMDVLRAFVVCEPAEAQGRGVTAEVATWPGRSIRGCYVPIARANELAMGRPERVVMAAKLFEDHVERTLRRQLDRFIGIQETKNRLATLEKTHRELVEAVVPARFTHQEIADVLGELLRQDVPIRDLRTILEALARCPGESKAPWFVAEHVRRALRDTLFARYAHSAGRIDCYQFSPALESDLAHESARGILGDELRERLFRSVEQCIDPAMHILRSPVLLMRHPELRMTLQRVLARRYPELVLLDGRDAPREVEGNVLGEIGGEETKAA